MLAHLNSAAYGVKNIVRPLLKFSHANHIPYIKKEGVHINPLGFGGQLAAIICSIVVIQSFLYANLVGPDIEALRPAIVS